MSTYVKSGEIKYDDQYGHVCTCTEAVEYDEGDVDDQECDPLVSDPFVVYATDSGGLFKYATAEEDIFARARLNRELTDWDGSTRCTPLIGVASGPFGGFVNPDCTGDMAMFAYKPAGGPSDGYRLVRMLPSGQRRSAPSASNESN